MGKILSLGLIRTCVLYSPQLTAYNATSELRRWYLIGNLKVRCNAVSSAMNHSTDLYVFSLLSSHLPFLSHFNTNLCLQSARCNNSLKPLSTLTLPRDTIASRSSTSLICLKPRIIYWMSQWETVTTWKVFQERCLIRVGEKLVFSDDLVDLPF
jgi:hypothetical protein